MTVNWIKTVFEQRSNLSWSRLEKAEQQPRSSSVGPPQVLNLPTAEVVTRVLETPEVLAASSGANGAAGASDSSSAVEDSPPGLVGSRRYSRLFWEPLDKGSLGQRSLSAPPEKIRD